MTSTWAQRLDVERRLLAALFLWPRVVELEPRHFIAPEHGFLFGAIQEAGNALSDPETAMPAVRAVLERDITAVNSEPYAAIRRSQVYRTVQWYENYVINELMLIAVTEHAIADLVEQVRECPRCGR